MNNRIAFADALRGLAALSVVVAHYGLAFWMPGPTTSQISNTPPLPDGVMPAASRFILATPMTFSLAAFGVGLFFLISGFVIPLSIERLSTLAFLRARAFRILPTYAAGFVVTIAALWAASLVYGRPFPYSASEVASHLIPGVRLLRATPFIDYVVWTLEIELAFYLVCAALARWLRRGSVLSFLAPAALLALAAGAQRQDVTLFGQDLAFMFTGVALSFHHSGRLAAFPALLLAGTTLAASLAGIEASQGLVVAASYGWAAGIFAAAYLVRRYFPDLAPLRWLAAISYPLYVVHGIAGYVAMRILLDAGVWPGAAVAIAASAAVAVSIALHVWIELPTQTLGKKPWQACAANISSAQSPAPLSPRR